MKIFYGYKEIKGIKDPVAAIGIFDGMHIGHKRVINRLIKSGGSGRDKIVVTFDPHPRSVLNPGRILPRIMSLEHRLLMLEGMGVDAVVVVSFTDHVAGMSPEDFIEHIIIGGIGARTVYVGSNFHFGRKKRGGVNTLKKMGRSHGVDVHCVRPVRRRGRTVSSTWVRKLISEGRLETAEKLLRRPVSVLGTVVRGEARGRELGFPTANIDPHHEVIPPPGVYAVKADISGGIYDGVLNIGFKPTFYGKKLKKRKEPHIEAHIFGIDRDLYGASMEIFFIAKLRNEKKFRTKEALSEQIKVDAKKAKTLLSDTRTLSRILRYRKNRCVDMLGR